MAQDGWRKTLEAHMAHKGQIAPQKLGSSAPKPTSMKQVKDIACTKGGKRG